MSFADVSHRASDSGSIPATFAEEDLARAFDAKVIQRGRSLILAGAVTLADGDGRIEASVADLGRVFVATVVPGLSRQRVVLERACTCGGRACAHAAAAAMLALDTRPEWRRAVQTSFLDLMAGANDGGRGNPEQRPPAAPARKLTHEALRAAIRGISPACLARWMLEPGQGEAALFVTAGLVPAQGGSEAAPVPATPREVAERVEGEADRAIARLLGSGESVRTAVPKGKPEIVDRLIRQLLETGEVRWHTGEALAEGPKQVIRAFRDAKTRKLRPTGIPPGGSLVKGLGYWCIDPAKGRISPVALQVVEPPKPKSVALPKASAGREALDRPGPGLPAASLPTRAVPDRPTIVERIPRVVARLGRVVLPAEGLVDVLRLSFDYGEPARPAEIDADDQRQFARIEETDGTVAFARRDKDTEQAALDRLSRIGFGQHRIETGEGDPNARGARVHRFAGRDADERWKQFAESHVPALESEGWTVEIGADFGSRVVEADRDIAVGVRDTGEGWFDLDVGVEIEGKRRPLLPILAQLIDRGGMAAARVIDGRAHVVLDDGNVLALPADRVGRLISVIEALIEAGRKVEDKLQVPLTEADALVDIDDLIARRPDETAQIDAYLRSLNAVKAPPAVPMPARFQGELRDYQRAGLAWLQNLRANGLAGILADDMGLGKTAQTLAHIALEHEEGRLTDPCLVVVPTSLVPNWASEAKRFVPHLKVLVLHGLKRHDHWHEAESADIVITTYGVVARDADLFKGRPWHLVVLDEAQAIKNPDAQATRAVCGLDTRHRLCLSGTPVENNLGELWSQFAFLMPGLLGDRKEFQRRFRTPIEKRGDATRAALLWRRIHPFLLRRTKTAVAKELPPKTEIIRHIELDPAQRDLYETIRLSVHETVRAAIAASGLARSAITVIDALLKLRQVCCDPRLAKIAAAASLSASAKLSALVDMVREMVPEGRRILIFSQFTTMLDLIKPELAKAGIPFVELTGKTVDRAAPVERFQAGAVPVFLISLKAGGRGLNLTAADTVIHYDPWWNPAAEAQATDRAYRIGQDKPVFVYKLIAADTVEERILELQRRKSNLTAATVDGSGLASALRDTDIDFLFAA